MNVFKNSVPQLLQFGWATQQFLADVKAYLALGFAGEDISALLVVGQFELRVFSGHAPNAPFIFSIHLTNLGLICEGPSKLLIPKLLMQKKQFGP